MALAMAPFLPQLQHIEATMPCMAGILPFLQTTIEQGVDIGIAESNRRMGMDGVRMDVATLQRPTPHSGHSVYGDVYSSYSDGWHLLERPEWYSLDVTSRTAGHEWVLATEAGQKPMFHGTEFGAAFQIVWQSLGFIVGEGTHRKGKQTFAGMWVVPSLVDALERADPMRYTDADRNYSRSCCPVVLEVRLAHLAKMSAHGTMHCSRWAMGQRHEGVLIQKVHFNIRLMENYMRLEDPDVRMQLRLDPYKATVCACRICGAMTWAGSEDFWEWEKSGKHWYTPRCLRRRQAKIQVVF